MISTNLLEIKDLTIQFSSAPADVTVVKGISFALKNGETLAIVGESGSGKSVTALSLLGLLPAAGKVTAGEAIFYQNENAIDLVKAANRTLRGLRGKEIAMIFQEPMTSLNPVFRCGEQVAEHLQAHLRKSRTEAKKQVLQLFEKVKLGDPNRIWRSYPHQLSGGQRQRVMIAMALACNPSLLIADEPTSALDVTVQRAILDLLKELKNEWGGSTIFITHDLAVAAEIADRLLVMRNGEIVEQGRVADVFKSPQHSYTKALLDNFQRLRQSEFLNLAGLDNAPDLLVINNLKTEFTLKKDFWGKPVQTVKAIDEVSLEIRKGETLGLVGESGSGKTTLGRSLLKLVEPGGGAVHYKGADLLQLPDSQWKPLRKELQIIFQDPYSSLSPKKTIGEAIMEPMRVHGLHRNEKGRRDKAIELLETVGLEATHFHRLPKAFSGGQRQRICIARALSLDPVFMVCDECVSALDVTTQIQVLDLLRVLQQKRGLTYLFISHDLSVVQKISHRIAVMKDGKIVEMGTTENVLRHPFSVYTRQLVESIPKGIG